MSEVHSAVESEEVVIDDPMTKMHTVWKNNLTGNCVYVRNVLDAESIDGYPSVVITMDGLDFRHMDYAELVGTHDDITEELMAVPIHHTAAVQHGGTQAALVDLMQLLTSEAMHLTKLDVVPFALVDNTMPVSPKELTEHINTAVGYWHSASASIASSDVDPTMPLAVIDLHGIVFLNRLGLQDESELEDYVVQIRQIDPEHVRRGSLSIRIDLKLHGEAVESPASEKLDS